VKHSVGIVIIDAEENLAVPCPYATRSMLGNEKAWRNPIIDLTIIPEKIPKHYTVYVQTTSYNRKVAPNQKCLLLVSGQLRA